MERLCEAKPIHHIEKALRSKADQAKLKGFVKQSQSIMMDIMMERLCEAKPTHHDGKALRSKANPSRWKGFAKQNKNHMNGLVETAAGTLSVDAVKNRCAAT